MNPISQHPIVVQNLTKRFGEFVAVDDVSFSVNEGEVFGWLGPNGAGKTTTIRMLLGLLHPTSGSTYVLGYNSATQTKAMHGVVGYMSQQFTLYDDLTAAENIRFYGRIYGLSRKELRARQAEIIADGRAGRPRRRADEHLVRRLEAAPGAGLCHRPPAQGRLSGRADRRRRPHQPPRVLDADLLDGQERGDDPGDHALHGRGRAVPAHRLYQPGAAGRARTRRRGSSRRRCAAMCWRSMPAIPRWRCVCCRPPNRTANCRSTKSRCMARRSTPSCPAPKPYRASVHAVLTRAGVVVDTIDWIAPSLEDVFISSVTAPGA